MRKTSRFALNVGLLFAWSMAAPAQEIRYNYVEGTDFSKYKTYKWVRIPNAQYPNSILDGETRKQIWRGEASKTLGSGKDTRKIQKNLNKAVAKLFKKYPPPVKS